MTELPRGAVTFLFSDIEGSTRLVKALRERYAQVLAEHRSLVREAITRQAGHEIDTQGDAFFVAFASAKQAVLCALEIQQALAGHEWPSGTSVRVRMGIHTGQATPVEGAYTGLAVHRAARICAAARGGQVLVSQAAQTLIEDEEEDLGFALLEIGERRLKDLDRPVRLFELAFELAAAGAVPEPPARDTGYAPDPAPIVGRAAELQVTSAACARVMAGQSQVLLITGEAGLGKTRLVEELAGQVRSAADGARVRVGESAPMAGAALAYGPFVAALGHEAGWLLADDGEGNMLAARHRLFARVLDLLAGLAARSPLVVVLEDLHWADESSRELLTFLAVRLRTERVMIVGTLREELTDSVRRWLTELEHRPGVTRLRLGRMPDTEIAGLVAGVMPAGASPEPPSQLQARVLAALATWRVLLGEADAALPLVTKAMEVAQEIGADAVYAHGLGTLGIIEAQYGDLEDGLADLQAAFTLACRVGSVEDAIRAAANRVYLLYRVGRFAEAVETGRAGRSAVAAMGAPPAITTGIGNNAAAALLASGRWAEADQLLAELVAESTTNFARYLQLLQLELAVGRGEGERAADLVATLRESPDDPRLAGSLHACLAEQALNADDLATAAVEVVDGLAALSGAELAEEELRLLAVGSRLAADLSLRPRALQPREILDGWEGQAATFAEKARVIVAEHGDGQPDLAAFGAQVAQAGRWCSTVRRCPLP